MLADLEGRVAVITGGGSGIGAALAGACAAAGMKVVVVDIDEGRAKSVTESLDGAAAVLPVATDVADPESVERLAEVVYDEFGATDLLCNNAGVGPPGLLWEFTPADWEWIVGVNLAGVVNGIRSFVPRMIAQGNGGHIVNTASIAALRPQARYGPYSATKHAVLGLSDVLRIDLVPFGIGVSVLCPTIVATNITDSMARPSIREDPAAVAAELDAFLSEIDIDRNTMIDPARVAELTLWGVREDEPYIMTAPGQRGLIAERYQAILDAHDTVRRHDPSLP